MDQFLMLSTFLADEATTLDGFEKVAIWIAIGCFFVPIFVLTIIVCIKTLIKKRQELTKLEKKIATDNEDEVPSKSNKKSLAEKVDYYKIFGGTENIITISKELTRVSLTVNDIELVDFDQIRELKIGVLIAGNTIKCSSAELVAYFDEK